MKPIYTAVNAAAARAAFDDLAERWGKRYPAMIRLRDNARKQFVPSLDNYLETIIRSTDESSSSRRQVCGFLGLPMADEDLVGPLGLFDDSVLFEALLRVVVRGAGHAEVAAPRRGPRGQLELASFVDDQPGPREDVVLVFGDQVPGQDGQFPGGRPWPITVVSGMDMTVQYHFIYLKTLSDRTAIEPADIGMGEPDPNDLDAPYVAPSPPDGAVIMCRSDWGPVKVIVAISADAFDVVSAPDLAQLDRDWQGVITLRDSAFDINTFDDAFFDHVLTRAGDHPVRVSWRYDHSRTITDENGPTPYQEYVIIRFANQGETR